MSMLRKAVLTTAIVGAGLGSMTGAAMAHDGGHGHGGHDAAKSCSNAIKGESENGAGRTLGDTTGGDQAFDASNTCDILNDNEILSGNNVATAGGVITNGDTTDITRTNTETTTETSDTTVPAGGAGGLGDLLGGLFG
ncbi:hypothetical protein WCD74_10570 [Actinomycetospora sp. OC33-EN08]|uniref:DUF320 domain-containing protein n=1 Tax=Actinomycetospora aurantiaca TaxID=3129233 RepID=A0ABU8MLS6_9PSEU